MKKLCLHFDRTHLNPISIIVLHHAAPLQSCWSGKRVYCQLYLVIFSLGLTPTCEFPRK